MRAATAAAGEWPWLLGEKSEQQQKKKRFPSTRITMNAFESVGLLPIFSDLIITVCRFHCGKLEKRFVLLTWLQVFVFFFDMARHRASLLLHISAWWWHWKSVILSHMWILEKLSKHIRDDVAYIYSRQLMQSHKVTLSFIVGWHVSWLFEFCGIAVSGGISLVLKFKKKLTNLEL